MKRVFTRRFFKKTMKFSLIGIVCLLLFVVGINLYVVNSSGDAIFEEASDVPACDVALVLGTSRILVVSQRFHVQRAIFIARAHDIEAYGYVAKDPVNSRSTAKVMSREYLARVKAFLDCYILGTEPKFPGPAEPIVFE